MGKINLQFRHRLYTFFIPCKIVQQWISNENEVGYISLFLFSFS